MKVYIAGSSKELDRVKRNMARLRAEGIEITHDWVSEIEAVGDANPPAATKVQRAGWATTDLLGVAAADVLWVNVPDDPSWGAGVELGYAIAHGIERISVVTSGPTHRSIFFAFSFEHATDDEAFERIVHAHRLIDGLRAGIRGKGDA